MSSKRNLEGYLLIDNRSSPGVTPEFLRATGKHAHLADQRVGEGHIFESATITCSHCHAIVVLNPDRSRPRNYCRRCDHYVCDRPGCLAECRPLNAVIEETREAIFLRTQAGVDPTTAPLIIKP